MDTMRSKSPGVFFARLLTGWILLLIAVPLIGQCTYSTSAESGQPSHQPQLMTTE